MGIGQDEGYERWDVRGSIVLQRGWKGAAGNLEGGTSHSRQDRHCSALCLYRQLYSEEDLKAHIEISHLVDFFLNGSPGSATLWLTAYGEVSGALIWFARPQGTGIIALPLSSQLLLFD